MAFSKRRSRDALLVVVAAARLALAAPGCTGKDPTKPGTSIGVFGVEAKLVSTTGGSVPDPWKFDVRLRHDGATLYWVQGDAPIAAPIDASDHAVLTSSVVSEMRPANEKTKTAACVMSRADVVDLVLTSPSTDVGAATSFTGSLGYTFAATDGSSCEDQLAESGGDFATIPCSVSYELVATRTGDAR